MLGTLFLKKKITFIKFYLIALIAIFLIFSNFENRGTSNFFKYAYFVENLILYKIKLNINEIN